MMVQRLTVMELAERLRASEGTWFLDVRTPEEWEIARIEGFRLLDTELMEELRVLDAGAELVFLCHHGIRSQAAAQQFADSGFTNVWNVAGGIDAWSREVDPATPRY